MNDKLHIPKDFVKNDLVEWLRTEAARQQKLGFPYHHAILLEAAKELAYLRIDNEAYQKEEMKRLVDDFEGYMKKVNENEGLYQISFDLASVESFDDDTLLENAIDRIRNWWAREKTKNEV